MYPIGGFVYVCKKTNSYGHLTESESGPYEIADYFQLDKGVDQMYYDLHGLSKIYHFLECELRPATKAEELYHKLTRLNE